MLLNSLSGSLQEGWRWGVAVRISLAIPRSSSRYLGGKVLYHETSRTECWTGLNTGEQCHVWAWQAVREQQLIGSPALNGPGSEKAKGRRSQRLLGKSYRPIYLTDGKSIVNHLERCESADSHHWPPGQMFPFRLRQQKRPPFSGKMLLLFSKSKVCV